VKAGLLFKWLREGGSPTHADAEPWSLPKRGRPGEWRVQTGPLVPCKSGIHGCLPAHLVPWISHTLTLMEYVADKIMVHGAIAEERKVVLTGRARIVRVFPEWNDQSARHFACDCADDALRLVANPDPRSVEAVRVARAFADGLATGQELAAAWDAARAAARDAQARRLCAYLGLDYDATTTAMDR
jgi:hypothetical protein